MCPLFVHPPPPHLFSTFLPVVKEGRSSVSFSFSFFSQTKKLNEAMKPQKRMCSLQNISRLGGEIYRNKAVSPCFANLDPESGRGDVLSITPEVATMLSKTSQNGGELEKHSVVYSLTCHNLASFGAIIRGRKGSLWKQKKMMRAGGRAGGLSCCCPQDGRESCRVSQEP